MNLHKMIEICLKDDNMHIFVMINALICINNYLITCINSMLSLGSVDPSRGDDSSMSILEAAEQVPG